MSRPTEFLQHASDIVDRMSSARVAVVGDVMLDRYLRGRASRLSPEAPVPVVAIEEESEHPGGAANVAANLVGLGVDVALFGSVGLDSAAISLRSILERDGVDASGLIGDRSTSTTVKTRVIADGQHVVRADRDAILDRTENRADPVASALIERLATFDAVVLQDYDKGTLYPRAIASIVEAAASAGIPVLVDPKRANFFSFRGVRLFKPNRPETEAALGRTIQSIDDAIAAAKSLRERLTAEIVVITLGSEGMVIVGDSCTEHISTTALEVSDVSGAGDTVIATLAASIAVGAEISDAARIANVAAGEVCSHVGTVPITAARLTGRLDRFPHGERAEERAAR